MGSAVYPNKKAPTNKANKPKSSGVKWNKAVPTLAVASASAQNLRIPTNLPICILDNGGWTVKFGLLPPPPLGQYTSDTKADYCEGKEDRGKSIASIDNATATHEERTIQMSCMYNATARPPHQSCILAGDEITKRMKNLGQLSWNYPLERGMICNGETQMQVWARVLQVLGVVPVPVPTIGSGRMATFLLLVSPFEPSAISEGVDIMLFRKLGMARVARMSGPCMVAVRYLSTMDSDANNRGWIDDNSKCCCVVDSGYSFTHVVPTHQGETLNKAIRRLNVGGKVLTNLLKEVLTYRQWNMMNEYHIVNDVKEKLCFVTDKFEEEMKQARSTRKGLRWFDREYLLPDFVSTFQGVVRLPEPLQRNKEVEEMKQTQKEMDKLNNKREQRETENEVKDLSNMQVEEECGANRDKFAINKSEDKQECETANIRKWNKAKKNRKHKIDKREKSSGNDSDEETDQQRLQRLKAMREVEQKRREQESLERQALAMSVERFAIPEVLFRPSDIGLDCGGIAEAISESIEACVPMLRAAMFHNVLLVGGNVKIPGFKERLELELRKLAPTNYQVRVCLPEDPASYAWEGAKQFSSQPDFQEMFSIDRLSWEKMKKIGMTQQDIWDKKMSITP